MFSESVSQIRTDHYLILLLRFRLRQEFDFPLEIFLLRDDKCHEHLTAATMRYTLLTSLLCFSY